MSNVAAVVGERAVSLGRGYAPGALSTVARQAFTPVLNERGDSFRSFVRCLLVPSNLCRLGLQGPAFCRLPNARTTRGFRLEVTLW